MLQYSQSLRLGSLIRKHTSQRISRHIGTNCKSNEQFKGLRLQISNCCVEELRCFISSFKAFTSYSWSTAVRCKTYREKDRARSYIQWNTEQNSQGLREEQAVSPCSARLTTRITKTVTLLVRRPLSSCLQPASEVVTIPDTQVTLLLSQMNI